MPSRNRERCAGTAHGEATALGVTIPQALLVRATDIIQ